MRRPLERSGSSNGVGLSTGEYRVVKAQKHHTTKVAVGAAIATGISIVALAFTALTFFSEHLFATKQDIGVVSTAIAEAKGEHGEIRTEQKSMNEKIERNYDATRLTNENLERIMKIRFRMKPAKLEELEDEQE